MAPGRKNISSGAFCFRALRCRIKLNDLNGFSYPMPPAPHIIPPPPDWPHPGVAAMLEKLEFGPVALELWQDYRLVRLFAETPPDRRSRLFHNKPSPYGRVRQIAAQHAAPELGEPFRTFAALRKRTPDARALAHACSRISDWAAERSYLRTAVEYARAAAAISPDDPAAANLAGLMLRRTGDWKRAEQFYERAIVLARRSKNKVEYICGHIGSAALLYSRGVKFDEAVRHLKTAARVAADSGSLWLASHALHDSMLLFVAREDYGAAEAEAERAVELYPLHDSRFPCFVVDFTFVQLEQCRYADAVSLLQRCLDVIGQPSIRGLITSMLARSYAGLGSQDEYKRLGQAAADLAKKHVEHASTIYYHLAEGARACRAWTEAERHAREARQFATARGDREMVRLAERSLSLSQARETAPAQRTPAKSLPEELGRILFTRLSRWAPSSIRSPRRAAFRNQWVA